MFEFHPQGVVRFKHAVRNMGEPLAPTWKGHKRPLGFSLVALAPHRFLVTTRFSTMESGSQQPKARDDDLSSLNAAIDALALARNETVTMKPVKDAFNSSRLLLVTIRVGSLPALSVQLLADVRRTRWLTKRTASN